jgi:tRNA (mo5U34)-methyltransferase
LEATRVRLKYDGAIRHLLAGQTRAEDVEAIRSRIEAVEWYHEFDFGDGLRAVTRSTAEEHRRHWAFIEANLARVDFRGKSVLDVGCWDGYWSFYAERRGARSVLATDDVSQNWAAGTGIRLARELLGSRIEINQTVPAYELARLGRKFDVILFLGVFYHLHDPFHALAQIRHCCHEGTVVVVEGSVGPLLPDDVALLDFTNATCEFLPSAAAWQQMLGAAYLRPTSSERLDPLPVPLPPVPLPGWRWRLKTCLAALRGSRAGVREQIDAVSPPPPPLNGTCRTFLVCRPFSGTNPIYVYRPPFGLHAYDDRFREAAQAGTCGTKAEVTCGYYHPEARGEGSLPAGAVAAGAEVPRSGLPPAAATV